MKFFLRTLVWSSMPLIVLYTIAPLLVYLFPYFMQHIFFLNFVKIPWREYHNLSGHGVEYVGVNFYFEVPGENSVRLGAWHVLPKTVSDDFEGIPTQESLESKLQSSKQPIVIYLHGNSFDRTTKHRVELYRILSKLNFHVISIDYRGYGDSTGRPTEKGIVRDAHAIYEHIRGLAPGRPIIIWGHSMGTGVATRMVAELSQQGNPPSGLVLESPFNNLPDVINNHPFSGPFRFLPWFHQLVIKPLMDSGLVMNSDDRIKQISCPILVFHAADDHIIPIKLGRKLVESAKSARRNIKLVEFEASRGLLHKYIHRAPEVPPTVMDFYNKILKAEKLN